MTAAFAQPSPPPGPESGSSAPPQTQTQAPSGPDPGAQSPFGGGGMMPLLIMVVPLLFLVLLTRSQSKKQKELEASLKVGDRVVTQAGLIGKITDLNERTARVEIAPGVNVTMLKTSIQGPDPSSMPSASKDAPKDKDSKEKK